MEIGIIGLPKSGKTTVFNALTKCEAEIEPYASSTLAPNYGIAKVQDARLSGLQTIFKPKKVIPAEVKYVDVAVPPGKVKGEGLSGELISHLSKADALIHVVRAFTDEQIPHIEGSVKPQRDIAIMDIELALSDLGIIERRLKRIEDSLKGAKSPEKDTLLREQALISRIKAALESEIPVRDQELNEDEAKLIENFQFLTAKPRLVVLNIGEEQLPQASALEQELCSQYPQFQVVAPCCKLEMELGQLEEADAEEFCLALGLEERALEHIIKLSYELLGLVSFFTTASGEVKAWTVHRNTPAPHAAGKIHSDMERGFIRAEVISYDDLMKCGSIAEARKQGLLHLEGKNYLVQDGDVITFLFSV
jgi:GTP-binding protein YchF